MARSERAIVHDDSLFTIHSFRAVAYLRKRLTDLSGDAAMNETTFRRVAVIGT